MDSYSVAAEDTLVADTLVEGILEVGSYPAEGILAVGNPEVDNPEADNLEERIAEEVLPQVDPDCNNSSFTKFCTRTNHTSDKGTHSII